MAQRREPGVLVLAKELNGAIEKHVEDREYSPTYLISEIGGKLSRVPIAGVLDQLENRGSRAILSILQESLTLMEIFTISKQDNIIRKAHLHYQN